MWSKLDDQFPDHPKVLRAGPLASWLYVCGTCYCNRLLTNGHIPLAHVRKLADVTNPLKLAAKLVEVGLWEEVEGGYQIHDFLDHNMSAEEAKQRQAETKKVRSEAGSKGAAARWQRGSKPDGNLPSPLPETVDGKTMAPNPNPLRPISTEVEIERVAPAKPNADKGTTLPLDFVVTDDLLGWATAKSMDYDVYINPILLAEKFITYYREGKGKTKRQLDWPATWHQWVLSEIEKGGHKNGQQPTATGNSNGTAKARSTERAIREEMEYRARRQTHGDYHEGEVGSRPATT